MPLFNYLGFSSPMFIPTQQKTEGFNIDYGALMPPKQQAPELPSYKLEKDLLTGDTKELDSNVLQAQNLLKQAYAQSGGNLGTLSNNPLFKRAQALATPDPFKINLQAQDKKQWDDTTKLLTDKDATGLTDVNLFKKTGYAQPLSQTIRAWDETPRSIKDKGALVNSDTGAILPVNSDEVFKYGQTVGTEEDLRDGLIKRFSEATGKTENELKGLSKSNFKSAIDGKVKEGYLSTLLSTTSNKEQLNAAVNQFISSMSPKEKDALERQFIDAFNMNPEDTKTKDGSGNTGADLFGHFVENKVKEFAETKSIETKKKDQDFKGELTYDPLENMLKLHRLKKEQKEDAPGPYLGTVTQIDRAGNTISPPTKTNNTYTTYTKDKYGNMVSNTVTGNYKYWGGASYTGELKAPTPVNSLGEYVYIGDTKIPSSKLSGLNVKFYNGVEDRPNPDNPKETDHTIHHNVIVTKEQLKELDLKVNIPKEKGSNEAEEVELYHNPWLGEAHATKEGKSFLTQAVDKDGIPIPDTYNLDVAVVVDPDDKRLHSAYDNLTKEKEEGDAANMKQQKEESENTENAFQATDINQ